MSNKEIQHVEILTELETLLNALISKHVKDKQDMLAFVNGLALFTASTWALTNDNVTDDAIIVENIRNVINHFRRVMKQ